MTSGVFVRGGVLFRSGATTASSMMMGQGRIVRSSFGNFSVGHFREFSSEVAGKKVDFEGLVKKNKVVVFMKGVPDEPRCGFSNAVVQILRMHGVNNYDSHDVLKDEDIRQGIKEFTNWPTIPQVFIAGEFVGGCDILIQMHQNGDLVKELDKAGIKSALLDAPPPSSDSSDKKS